MKCGVFQHYPVKVVIEHDAGFFDNEVVIGTAETIGQAVKLAEREGYLVRDPNDGGQSRFLIDKSQGRHYFIVTAYPD